MHGVNDVQQLNCSRDEYIIQCSPCSFLFHPATTTTPTTMPSPKTAIGTESPPLEATGQEEPMGVTGASGTKAKAVPDSEQRERE